MATSWRAATLRQLKMAVPGLISLLPGKRMLLLAWPVKEAVLSGGELLLPGNKAKASMVEEVGVLILDVEAPSEEVGRP